MKGHRCKRGTQYGAHELKVAYQRNMTVGILTAVVLAMATTAYAFLFTQSSSVTRLEPKPVTVVDSIIIDFKRMDRPDPVPPKPARGGPAGSRFGSKIEMVIWDEEIREEIDVISFGKSYSIGDTSVGYDDESDYFDRFKSTGYVIAEYPGPEDFVAVDKEAEMIYEAKPDYPRLAVLAGLEATVSVRALIDVDGSVLDAFVFKSSNNRGGFNEAAVKAAFNCKYSPAIWKNQATPVWVSYKVEFILESCR